MTLKVSISFDAEAIDEVNHAINYLSSHRDHLLSKADVSGKGNKGKGKPDAAKPEAAKPEAAKPEAAKPEAAKPEAAKPEAAKPAGPDYAKDVVPAVTGLLSKKGRDAAAAVLAQFGAKKADQVPQEKWQELIDACTAALAEDDNLI